jgi:hypothetical protein
MGMDSKQLLQRYWEFLQQYLKNAGERSLNRSYEFTRRALGDSLSVATKPRQSMALHADISLGG